jgi:hypothetical protein
MGIALPPLSQLSPEHLRALRGLQDGVSYARYRADTIDRLLEARLAWVGPPPACSVQISYRGRQALRELEDF